MMQTCRVLSDHDCVMRKRCEQMQICHLAGVLAQHGEHPVSSTVLWQQADDRFDQQ